MPLTECNQDQVTASTLSIDTPGEKRNRPVESNFEDVMKKESFETNKGREWKKLSVNTRKTWRTGATSAEEIVPVVEFGEPTLMETELYKEARDKFLSKMFYVRETRPNSDASSCKDSSTLKKKTNSEKVQTKMSNRDKTIIITKSITLHKIKGGRRCLRQETGEGKSRKNGVMRKKQLR